MEESMADDYFGLCPECHRTDGHVTDFTGLDYFACVEHRKRWLVGANLFPQDGAEPKQRFTWEDAAGFEDITRREFRSHDYYCPVCRAPMIGDQKNICDHCRAVWPTHEEVACSIARSTRWSGQTVRSRSARRWQ